uniref:Zinc finger PHD-type domain-containing protein n=1 Tax=Oryza brachyantha TaxID=4533 RepID=J3MS88_ORYBR
MIHFVRSHPAHNERALSNNLSGVFRSFVTKPPEVDDLRKQYPLIMHFVKKDPTLLKSKILRRLIKDSWNVIESELRKASPKQSFIVSNESYTSHGDYSEDGNSDDNGDSDTYSDATDDDTDPVCAICDEGGTLLSCKGECKRSFHPKQKDGVESFCETLGYTSREVKEIPTFICSNCQYKQHQCFKCGKLDSSHETNPKVFQCCNSSCGHFYHPKCVATLLEPGDSDGACELEKHIVAGMPFTCPAHWFSKCKQMEDRAERDMWLAACRRCVKSYHRKCLPMEISFETMDVNITTRAWEVPKGNNETIFIYCMDHDVDATMETPCRDHIKFPLAPKIKRIKDLAKKKVKVTYVSNIDEVSREYVVGSTKPRGQCDQTQEGPIGNPMGHNLLQHAHATNDLKVDMLCEPPIVGASAAPISSEVVNRQEKQAGTSILKRATARISPCAAEKRYFHMFSCGLWLNLNSAL